jgi:hypothetical protein
VSGFACLYYTDCRPGQGLQGSAGFQFQAATPGDAATEAMPLVQRSALYEPPATWMQQRRPVADYPLSLAHVAEGDLVATAAGRYLGQEANGTRQGNQFTHAVVARDAEAYGTVRPAQLWAAPWWADSPTDGTVLEPLPAHPATGPLETETVRERVRAATGGEDLLVTLLSAVHHLRDSASRRKVVLVAADPELAACWIAAATLLMPLPQALRTTFKIFVADAQYGQHDIIALHPEWAGRWAHTGADTGLLVFDLERGRHTPVEPTAAARFWAPRFLAEDAYDIVDAVELSGQWARWADREPTAADRTVAHAVAAGASLRTTADVVTAAEWLSTGPDRALLVALDPVLDAVLAAEPHAAVLRTLAAASNRMVEKLPAILARLQTAEIAEVDKHPDGAGALQAVQAYPKLSGYGIGPVDDEARTAEIEKAIRVARVDRVPALLQLAERHRVALHDEHIRDAAQAFTTWWLANDNPVFASERWASARPLGWAGATLRESLAQDRDQAKQAEERVRSSWWRPLWSQAQDPTDSLDALLFGTAYARLDEPERPTVMRRVLHRVAERVPRDDESDVLAWNALFHTAKPTVGELTSFLDVLGQLGIPLSPGLLPHICSVLEEVELSADTLRIARRLPGGTLTPGVSGQLEADRLVQRLVDELRSPRPTVRSGFAAALHDEAAIPLELVEIRADDLVGAMVTAPFERALSAVVGLTQGRAKPLYQALERRWPTELRPAVTEDGARAMAFAFKLTMSAPGDEVQQKDFASLRHKLGLRARAMSEKDRAQVAKLGDLGPPWGAWLAELEQEGRRRWPLWGRSSGKHHEKDA